MELTGNIYIHPRGEDKVILEIDKGNHLKLLLTLYGLCDAGDYLRETPEKNFIDVPKMKPVNSNIAMYTRTKTEGKRYQISRKPMSTIASTRERNVSRKVFSRL